MKVYLLDVYGRGTRYFLDEKSIISYLKNDSKNREPIHRYKVTVLDSLVYKQMSLTTFCHNPNFEFVLGDVRDYNLLAKLVQSHDIVIPLAAIVGMPACKKDPILTVAVNYQQIVDITKTLSSDQKLLVPNTNSQYGSSDSIKIGRAHV